MYNKDGLNQHLLLKNNVSKENQEKIVKKYDELKNLFDELKKNEQKIKENKKLAFEYINKIQDLEFELQELWGFDQNPNYHRYWHLNPICQCPRMDNNDYFGVDRRIYSSDCPLHGHILKELAERNKNANTEEIKNKE